MLVRHIMHRPVITVRPQTVLPEIARLLHEQRLGGVPVVDDGQRVLGMVTERDLFLKPKRPPFSGDRLPSLFRQWVDPTHLAEAYHRSRHRTAYDVMTQPVICCEAHEPAGQIAWLMALHAIGHVPVVMNSRLVGIVTRRNIVRLLAAGETWRSS